MAKWRRDHHQQQRESDKIKVEDSQPAAHRNIQELNSESAHFGDQSSLEFTNSRDRSADDLYDRINDLRSKLGLSRLEMGFSPVTDSTPPSHEPVYKLNFEDDEEKASSDLSKMLDKLPQEKKVLHPEESEFLTIS